MWFRRWWANVVAIAPLVVGGAVSSAVGAQDSTARSAHASTPVPAREQGTFRFVARSGSAGVVAEGSFIVTDDSVTIEMTPGPCRYDNRSRPGGVIAYLCADTRVAFDRRHPSVRPMLTYQRLVAVRTVNCVVWNYDARGNRTTCQRSEVDVKESVVPTTIRLNPTR